MHRSPVDSKGILPLAISLILLTTLTACGADTPSDSPTSGTGAAPATQGSESGSAPLPGSVATDREALVAFYNALGGPNWEGSVNWLSNAPLDEWSGVSTHDNGRVRSLILAASYGEYLKGELPSELGDLGALEQLTLTVLQLTGSIPPELGNLDKLFTLELSYTFLSGEIPPELGNLARLQTLNLSNNQLSGEIPSELSNLARLQTLNLSGNQLSGEIPPELGNLPDRDLTFLDLGGNRLSGEIPPELGNLVQLQSLDLRGNQLSGKVPASLADLDFGRSGSLKLSGNQFECIPSSLRDFVDSISSMPDC